MKHSPMAGRTASTACWTIFYLYLALSQVRASGVFELHLQSYRNDKGLNADGNCCNGYVSSEGTCTATCKTFFFVCLTHYQAAIATQTNPACTFGEYTSPVIADNSFNVSVQSDVTSASTTDTENSANRIRFPIKNFSWPGDFSLIIEAFHDSTLNGPSAGSERELISRLAVQRSADPGLDWYNSRQTTRNTELVYSYRFVCDQHYYGPSCETLCRDRDDHFGHYYCSQNGTKVCLDGWKGEYCDDAICLSGCHPSNGYCSAPYECTCRGGWEGRQCDQCTPHPYCQHGTCDVKPGECNCLEGWGGIYCNQDLNFCTHYTPCKNGGTCTNTGEGSYTCQCKPGYNGTDCQHAIDHCLQLPCLHGGSCQNSETGYTCSCVTGYFGENCEQVANSCRPETCYNGGTCVDHDGSYQCLCALGYEGFHCEKDTGGCKADTCKNGGRCVGRRCICPTGLYGPSCEDDGQDYCAHAPCLNGGTCLELTHDFQCRCVAGFVGPTCAVNVDDCEMRPCANGGLCSDLVNDFQCQCQPGWIAKDCSVNQDDCHDQPCQHGGTCRDRINSYECDCPEGFWGQDCHLYEGMTTTSVTSSPPAPNTTQSRQVTTEDPLHQSGTVSGQAGDGSDDGLATKTELLLGVCLGVGIPILLVTICVAVLLCRRFRRHRPDKDDDKERQENYLNNISVINTRNKTYDQGGKCVDEDESSDSGGTLSSRVSARRVEGKGEEGGGGSSLSSSPIFTTSAPSVMPAAAASVMKVSNEDQQNINRLNKQQAARGKNANKHFLTDNLGLHEPAHTPSPLPSLPSHRDCRVHGIEKPVRRLDVDPVSEDTQVDISTFRRHSGDIGILGKCNLDQDIVRRSVFLLTEDYVATEV